MVPPSDRTGTSCTAGCNAAGATTPGAPTGLGRRRSRLITTKDVVPDAETDLVRAGGGVVWRNGPGGSVEVVIVHRPKYDDWSLPKGKCDPGEPESECAVREVEEETGLRCLLGEELAASEYVDRKGRAKRVRWWAMTVDSGEAVAANEVDEVQWVPVELVRELLSYPRDSDVVDTFEAARAD